MFLFLSFIQLTNTLKINKLLTFSTTLIKNKLTLYKELPTKHITPVKSPTKSLEYCLECKIK